MRGEHFTVLCQKHHKWWKRFFHSWLWAKDCFLWIVMQVSWAFRSRLKFFNKYSTDLRTSYRDLCHLRIDFSALAINTFLLALSQQPLAGLRWHLPAGPCQTSDMVIPFGPNQVKMCNKVICFINKYDTIMFLEIPYMACILCSGEDNKHNICSPSYAIIFWAPSIASNCEDSCRSDQRCFDLLWNFFLISSMIRQSITPSAILTFVMCT